MATAGISSGDVLGAIIALSVVVVPGLFHAVWRLATLTERVKGLEEEVSHLRSDLSRLVWTSAERRRETGHD